MAPTEILAEQHARTLGAVGRRRPAARIALLTASTPRAARESQLALLAAGKLDIVVGTHALLAERVAFARLGLVVIDEQHRFGVAQRALLRDKGGLLHAERAAPHLLVMTATPIPRTLALTAYGDLDVTMLDELPPGASRRRRRVLHGATRPRARAQAICATRSRRTPGLLGLPAHRGVGEARGGRHPARRRRPKRPTGSQASSAPTCRWASCTAACRRRSATA